MFRPGVLHVVTTTSAATRDLIPLTTATHGVVCDAADVVTAARRCRPALFHVHDPSAAAAVSAIAGGRPWVVSVPGAAADEASRSGLRRADLVVCSSVAARQQLRGDIDPQRLICLPAGDSGDEPIDAGWLAAEPGALAADLEEHYLALIATGRPAAHRAARAALPTVSVVVVTHNRRRQLARAMWALRAQSYPHDLTQLVVIDNASTDGSAEDLARLRDRVDVLREPVHTAAAAARNHGIARSTGEIVVFTDDDCFPTRDWIAALVSGFRSGIGIVQGRTIADPSARLTPLSRTQWTPAEYGLYETANIAYLREHLTVGFDESFAATMATALGRRLGRYPFGEDVELAWRVKRKGVASRFAATAVVHHEVTRPNLRYQLRRSVVGGLGFPVLAREVPELRDRFFWHHYFVSSRHAALGLAAAALPMARRWPLVGLAGVSPYLATTLRPRQPGLRDRIVALPLLALRDGVDITATAVGAIRAREPLL